MDNTVPTREALIVDSRGVSTHLMFEWMQRISNPPRRFTGVIATAPLTGPGTPGSMTFVDGVLVSQVPST